MYNISEAAGTESGGERVPVGSESGAARRRMEGVTGGRIVAPRVSLLLFAVGHSVIYGLVVGSSAGFERWRARGCYVANAAL